MPTRNQKRTWLGITLCLVALMVIWYPNIRTLFSHMREQRSFPTVEFGDGTTVNVEIADTQAERMQGLSGHERLLENEGMLFLFKTKEIQGFWMKDMLFPIDIIWMDGSTVVGFEQEAPLEDPVHTIYYSPAPVDRVLEVQAGFVAQNDVQVGDVLDVQLSDE